MGRPTDRLVYQFDRQNLGKPRKGAVLQEETWSKRDGEVLKYNLAYINLSRFGRNHGRVLGYDNRHGEHHRHYMGVTEVINFPGYEALLHRFIREVHQEWEREDENQTVARKRRKLL